MAWPLTAHVVIAAALGAADCTCVRSRNLDNATYKCISACNPQRKAVWIIPSSRHLRLHRLQLYACAWWYIGTGWIPGTLTELEGVPADRRELAEELFDSQMLSERKASWVYFYSGLDTKHLWETSVSIGKQYLFSFYWSACTLSTNSLVGNATPKGAPEVWFTIVCMLTTMTFYAFGTCPHMQPSCSIPWTQSLGNGQSTLVAGAFCMRCC